MKKDTLKEMNKVVTDIRKETERRVAPTVKLGIDVLKAITKDFNLPELQAFYHSLFESPDIKQYSERGIR